MSDREFNLTEEQAALMEEIIANGQRIVFPERAEQWEEYVEERFRGEYAGQDAVEALSIIEALNRGDSLDDAKKLLKETEPNGKANWFVRQAVLLFADRGPEFWKDTSEGHISLRTRFQLWRIARDNRRIKKVYSYMLPAGEEKEKNPEVENVEQSNEQAQSWVLGEDDLKIVNGEQSRIAKEARESAQVESGKQQEELQR